MKEILLSLPVLCRITPNVFSEQPCLHPLLGSRSSFPAAIQQKVIPSALQLRNPQFSFLQLLGTKELEGWGKFYPKDQEGLKTIKMIPPHFSLGIASTLQPSAASWNSSKLELLPAAPAETWPGSHRDFLLVIRRCQMASVSLRSCQHTLSLPRLPPHINSFQAVKA